MDGKSYHCISVSPPEGCSSARISKISSDRAHITVDVISAKLKASSHLRPPSLSHLILRKACALVKVVAKAHPDNHISEPIKQAACWATAAAGVSSSSPCSRILVKAISHLGSAGLCDSPLTWFGCPKCPSYPDFLHQDDTPSRLKYPAPQWSGGIHNSLLVWCRHTSNTTARWFSPS